MQRRRLIAATDRSEDLLRRLPTVFTGQQGEVIAAPLVLDGATDDASTAALLLLQYVDGLIEVFPPLISGPFVVTPREDAHVMLTERGRHLVAGVRRREASEELPRVLAVAS